MLCYGEDMKFNYTEIPSTGQKFYIKGDDPVLLIVSGTHGDEYEIVPIVEDAVMRYQEKLPAFLYVPGVSPSALSLRTRKNKDGLDINRSFFEGVQSDEVKQMMNLWKKFRFNLFLTFHKDPTREKFYLYDGMKSENHDELNLESNRQLELLRKDILGLGVELYTGIDDPEDPDLGYQVQNGYVHWPMTRDDHSSDYWLVAKTGIARHVINPEVPGKISLDKKREIVDAIFRRLLLKEKE